MHNDDPHCPHNLAPEPAHENGEQDSHSCEFETTFQLPPLSLARVQERFQNETCWQSFDTGRRKCQFYVWGDGPPVVFVHGLCDDAQSFLMPISRLTGQFRCISYELPGNNPDDGTAGMAGFSHDDLMADFYALVDHVGLEKAYVFGSSFGSTIALRALHEQPHRFLRGVLQGGFARRELAPSEELLACFARYWPWRMDKLPLREEMLRHSEYQPFVHREPAAWDYYLERSGNPIMQAVARRALLLIKLDLRPILKHIHQPTLLVCGDCDNIVGKDCEQELLEQLPNCVRVELENCGHVPQFSHPEHLAEVTRRFLTAH